MKTRLWSVQTASPSIVPETVPPKVSKSLATTLTTTVATTVTTLPTTVSATLRMTVSSIVPSIVLTFVLTLVLVIGAGFSTAYAQTLISNDSIIKFGGSVVVAPDEVVNGNVVVFGGSVETDGRIDGDLVVFGGSIRVNQFVGGDVITFGGSIYLGPDARISGDAVAMGGSVQKSPGAVISGTERIRDGRWWAFRELRDIRWNVGFRDTFGWRLIVMAGYFVFALAMYSFFPQALHHVSTAMERSAGRSFLIGLVAMIVLVPLIVITAITIIGLPITAALIIAFLAAKAFGYVAAVMLIGERLGRALRGDNGSSTEPMNQAVCLIIGVVSLGLIGYVPVLGWLVSLLVSAFSIGAVLDTRFGSNRPWIPPRQAA